MLDQIYAMLQVKKTLLMDGAFNYCIQIFHQIFTILFLEIDKKESTYYQLFNLLIKECLSDCIDFNPETIVVDLEISIQNAIRLLWPQQEL